MTNNKNNLNEKQLDLETLDLISGGRTEIGTNSTTEETEYLCPHCGQYTKAVYIPPLQMRHCARCHQPFGIK